jgi:hypothetical protein
MTYGMDRDFARLLTDEEIVALPAPKAFRGSMIELGPVNAS